MPLTRKPGIGNVRDSTRSVQGALDAVRQRIEAIEVLLLETESIARASSSSSTDTALNNLQSQINSLRLDLTALTLVVGTTDDLIDDAVRDEILEAAEDTDIPRDTRLVIVSAVGNDVVLTLPSGDIDTGTRTQEITVYRRDSGSGPPGDVLIRSLTGEFIDGSYELVLLDLEHRTFMAVGDEGWIET